MFSGFKIGRRTFGARNVGLFPPWGGLRPPYQKSWIRLWIGESTRMHWDLMPRSVEYNTAISLNPLLLEYSTK